MQTAYLGLGSNLGNRLAFLRGGRDALVSRPETELIRASAVYESEALGGPPDSPPFLNAVLEIRTSLSSNQLLDLCLSVEGEFGRVRPTRWAPRTLDIDILFYSDLIVNEEHLIIPHPRLQERNFVLTPLREIAPNFRHPLLDSTINALAANLVGDTELLPLRADW